MYALLMIVAAIVVAFGALFFWVARTRSFTFDSPSGSAGHGWVSWPKNCYDLCTRDPSRNTEACAVQCSLLQD